MSEPSEAPPAPRRRLSAADRRAAILEAALQVFSERGFKQASLDEVAERGGVSKALIYEHFASKRELQLALLDAYVHDLIDRVVRASAAVEAPEDRLRAGIEALLEFAEERPAALRLLTRNVDDPVAGAALDRLREEAAAACAELMVAHAPEPRPGDLPVETTVAILAHLIAGGVQFLAGWWLDHRDVPRAAVIEALMDLYWVGLERLTQGEHWK